jgi:L-iditol 2-dehydrogenase
MESGNMKAVKKYSDKDIYFKLVDETEPAIQKDKDVKIKIDAIGICTSDIHVLYGNMQMPDGNTVGHEFSGTVAETGASVTSVKPGDKVVCELAKGACMQCKMCKSGHYELCPEKQPPGWKSQGIYAEYTIQPEYCIHKLPEGIPMEVAAMAEPVAISVYGCLERGRVQKGDFTVIFGMGSIGLFTLITLLDAGIKEVVCVVPTARGKTRYNLAAELGAPIVLSTDENIETAVLEMNNGWKADCVIDCSGHPDAINQGIKLVNKNGKFIGLGICNDVHIPFAYNHAVVNVIEMIFSATSSHDSWVNTLGILERNKEKIRKIITHSFPLEEWEKAYEALENREAIKAVLLNSK